MKSIEIPVLMDNESEGIEKFRISLSTGTGYVLRHIKKYSTVSIYDSYIPTITDPSNSCDNFSYNNGMKPTNGPAEHIEAYFSMMPSSVYLEKGGSLDLELKFNDPVSDTDTNSKHNRQMYVVAYDENNEEASVFMDGTHYFYFDVKAADTSKSRSVPLKEEFSGYLRYRLVPREQNNNSWFDITMPCEFHVWYVDAFKPGITLTVGSDIVRNGESMEVAATATPIPSRDIVVPITFSDTSRLQNATNLNITIPAGQASGKLDVSTQSFENGQTNEIITVTASTSHNYWLDNSRSTKTVSIVEDNRPYLSVADARGTEGTGSNGNVEFTINLSAVQSTQFMVDWAVSLNDPVSAEASDFVNGLTELPSGTVTFGLTRGSTSRFEKFLVPIAGDAVSEPNETFTVTLSNISIGSVGLGTNRTAEGTIEDDDGALLSIADARGTEDTGTNTNVEFTVNLATAQSSQFTVDWSVNLDDPITDGSATAEDFVNGRIELPTGTVTFGLTDGITSKIEKFMVPIVGDAVPELTERFTVRLSNLSVTDGSVRLELNTTAEGFITDDDSNGNDREIVSIFSLGDVEEGTDTEVRFTITSNKDDSTAKVRYTVSQSGFFIFQPVSNTIVLQGSETVLRFPIIDNFDQDSNANISVTLVESDSYDIGISPKATANIRDIVDSDSDQTVSNQRYSVVEAVITSILTQQTEDSPTSPDYGNQTVPEISIVALEPIVNEGSRAKFRVKSSEAVSNRLTVNFRIDRTNEVIGGNSTVSVAMEPGVLSVPLELATRDDDLAGNDGRLTATVIAGEGYRVGLKESASVVISDEPDRLAGLNHTVLADIAASIGTRTLDSTGNRMLQAFSEDAQTGLKLAGGSTIRELLETGGTMVNQGELDWKSLLDGSSFSASLYPEDGGHSLASIWGIGDHRNLSGNKIGFSESWDGEVLTGHLGFDAMIGQGMLVGLTASVTQADVEIDGNGDAGALLNVRSTGLHPYFGLVSSDGSTQVQVTIGYGMSELGIESDRYSTRELTGDFQTFGVEGNSRIFSSEGVLLGGHSSLNFAGESWLTRHDLHVAEDSSGQFRTVASHIRMAVEGTHAQELVAGHKVSPSVSVGMRRDGRDDMAVFGYEIGSGVIYEASHGFSFDVSGLTVLSGLTRLHEWKVQGSMDYDAGNDDLGVFASMQPTWSATGPEKTSFLWGNDLLDVSDDSGIRSTGVRVGSEIGYGFTVADRSWKLIPYGSVSFSEGKSNEFRIGNRFRMDNGISFEIKGSKMESSLGNVSNSIKLTGNISW